MHLVDRRIKVGVVGTAHSHAAGKTVALRKLSELFDVVGVVEPVERRAAAAAGRVEYRGLRFLSEQQMLNAPGLQAVLIETGVADLVPTAMRYASAGLHIHLEKRGRAGCRQISGVRDFLPVLPGTTLGSSSHARLSPCSRRACSRYPRGTGEPAPRLHEARGV